jgi:hypothetical protein
MNESVAQESDSRRIVAILSFSRDFLTPTHGAKSATAISFTGRTEEQDHGVHETELRRSGLGGDVCRAGAVHRGRG